MLNRISKKFIYAIPILMVVFGLTMIASAFSGPGTVPPPTGTATSSAVLSVSQGGTGASTIAGAASAIGGAFSGPNSNISYLSGLTTVLPRIEGGTGVASVGPSGNILTSNGSGVWLSQTPSFGSNGSITTSGSTPTGSQIVSSTYTSSYSSNGSFTVPAGVGSITITAYGAAGGTAYNGGAGYGGEAWGTLAVTSGSTYYIGFNGMTWISLNSVFDGSAILVAGGGGSAGPWSCGGGGGGSSGGGGCQSHFGYPGGGGGTQSGGGSGGGSPCQGYANSGGFGAGGAGRCGYGSCGGNGGNGWYGGGGGGIDCSEYWSGGGGGSSYLSPWLSGAGTSGGVNSGGGALQISYVLPNGGGSNPQYGSATIVGNDNDGTITMPNMTVPSFTITFSQAFSRAPSCVASASNGATVSIGSESTTAVTFTFSSSVGNAAVNYMCLD